jgi:uncharacterized protein (DUF849 family)
VVDDDDLLASGAGTDFVSPEERVQHIEELRPEIYSLDCGTTNFGAGNVFEINIPDHVRAAASLIGDCGVKAELEVFDLGQLMLVNQLLSEGVVPGDRCTNSASGSPVERRRRRLPCKA